MEFSIFPKNATTYRFWTNSSDITIFNDGRYTAKGVATALVFYQYYSSYNLQSEVKCFKLDVVEKLTDFNCVITNAQGGESKKFVVDKDYHLVMNANGYTQADFRFSDNIILKSSLVQTGAGYQVTFRFKSLGEQQVKVSLIEASSLEETVITAVPTARACILPSE